MDAMDKVADDTMEKKKMPKKFSHTLPIHTTRLPSPLSKEAPPESYRGFMNLSVLTMIAIIIRMLIENFRKYGFLLRIPTSSFAIEDMKLVSQTWCLIAFNLLSAYLIELWAAQSVLAAMRSSKQHAANGKPNVRITFVNARCALLHAANSMVAVLIPSYIAWVPLRHPLLAGSVLFPSVILFLKLISYSFVNRDLRDAFVKHEPSEYSVAYPANIGMRNITYFWLAPTLCYQPSYPRSLRFRKSFFAMRVAELLFILVALYFLIEQYATPTLKNSIKAIDNLDLVQIAERVLKLSTVSLAIWLLGFYALFHSFLNALAEVLMFGDRTFYLAWWNSGSLATYWRLWNRPVYQWCKRHVYLPCVARGMHPLVASLLVFFISAVLHEVLVAIPTHSLLGVAFMGMIFQIPLIIITRPLEKMRGQGTMIGNCIFWVSFTIIGQPTCALLYFHSAFTRAASEAPMPLAESVIMIPPISD